MNRRRFFGNLGLIIAASAAPMVLVPKTPINWGHPTIYVPKTYQLKAVWSDELLQDLRAYHNINAEAEMNALLREHVEMTYPNREIVSITKSKEVHYEPPRFTPRRYVYATIMEPVV